MKTLVDTILEAVAKGGSVEMRGAAGGSSRHACGSAGASWCGRCWGCDFGGRRDACDAKSTRSQNLPKRWLHRGLLRSSRPSVTSVTPRLVFVDALTTRGDYYYQCRHGVARLMFDQAAIGADAVLAEAVRSATDAVLNEADKEQGQ